MSTGAEYRYVYDDLGQLLREDNTVTNKTYVYEYDNAGNITSKKTYALTAEGATPSSPISTITYGYTDPLGWGDLLTSYSGGSITYDAIGNPLTYYNGNSYTFEWENGRQLAAVSSDDLELEFVYNDEGIRTQKIANGAVHTYHLSGSQIISEEWGNHLLVYLYDSNGSPMGMQYRRSSMAAGEFYTFWFEKNLQGDIVAVYNSAGTKVVSYAYDAWGNCTTAYHNITGTNSHVVHNPFRYRGYYFDTELGFYYLNSRYYDPSVGRFINADIYVSTGQGLLGYNMFAYCLNDPVSHKDDQGTDPISVTDGEDNPTLNEMILGSGGGGSSGSGNGSGSAGSNSGYGYNISNTQGVSGGTGNTGTTTGYETFANFKSAYGSAGENMHWHHIVEQCQINRSFFSPYSIHNINNIIAVDGATHKLISAHYSSKLAMNGTMVVRDWLATQDFDTQYEYGMKIYRQFSQKGG